MSKFRSQDYRQTPVKVAGVDCPDGAGFALLFIESDDGEKLALKMDYTAVRSALEYISFATFKVGRDVTNNHPHIPLKTVQTAILDEIETVFVAIEFGTIGRIQLSLSSSQAAALADQLQQRDYPPEPSRHSH